MERACDRDAKTGLVRGNKSGWCLGPLISCPLENREIEML
jgi:hypothetical protein